MEHVYHIGTRSFMYTRDEESNIIPIELFEVEGSINARIQSREERINSVKLYLLFHL